jgi:osomolarity two-component system, response regulator SKN7
MNNKDALDNIRRKAPATRKPPPNPDDMLMPTQQVDMLNGQVQAIQQQVVQLQEKNLELTLHNNIMAQDFLGLQKTVLNHEHVLQSVVSFLNDFDAKRRRDSRSAMFPHTTGDMATTNTLATAAETLSAYDEDVPPSPLLHAVKLLSETNIDVLFNRGMEHMNEIAMRTNGTILHSPGPDFGNGRSTTSGPPSAGSSGHTRFADLDSLVYPVGTNNGIDPMFGDHINSVPYPLPSKAETPPALHLPKKTESIDPGWLKAPSILLVEDDPTCRKIGNKLLHAFNCQVTMAVSKIKRRLLFVFLLMKR